MTDIKYVHTNLIAKDWKVLSDFYIEVFKCKPIPPERDLSGEWIDKITGIDSVRIQGIHLQMPGSDDITLEIFQYSPCDEGDFDKSINTYGFGHLAFHVDDIEGLLLKVKAQGGSQLGQLITKEYEGIGTLKVVYIKDPEGNFVELQNWQK